MHSLNTLKKMALEPLNSVWSVQNDYGQGTDAREATGDYF